MDATPKSFGALMGEGVDLHNDQRYDEALAIRRGAFAAASGPMECGSAARDISATYDRLGDHRLTSFWAQQAVEHHHKAMARIGGPEAQREYAVSTLQLGAIGLRSTLLGAEDHPPEEETLLHFLEGWSALQAAKRRAANQPGTWVDQYEINHARRMSMALSLLSRESPGSKGRTAMGFLLGMKAIGIAPLSESPLLATSNPDISTGKRNKAKFKAFLGGLGATAVNVVALVSQPKARKLANKVL